MKRLIFICLLLIFVAEVSTSQVIREIRNLKPFTTIKLASGINLILAPSDRRLVRGEAERTIVTHVCCDVDEESGVMQIYATKFKWKDSKKINVYVDYDSTIVRIESASGNRVRSELPIKGERIDLICKNGGDFYINLDVEKVRAKGTNGSNIKLLGRAKVADVTVDNGSVVKSYDLDCQTMLVTATLASAADVYASRTINVTANNDSEVRYKGDPENRTLNVDKGSRAFAQ